MCACTQSCAHRSRTSERKFIIVFSLIERHFMSARSMSVCMQAPYSHVLCMHTLNAFTHCMHAHTLCIPHSSWMQANCTRRPLLVDVWACTGLCICRCGDGYTHSMYAPTYACRVKKGDLSRTGESEVNLRCRGKVVGYLFSHLLRVSAPCVHSHCVH